MPTKRLQGEIITGYLEKWNHLNSLTLAKKIYKENPEVWNTVDAVRSLIRIYRGRSGKKERDKLADKRFMLPDNQFHVPQADDIDYTPFSMPLAQDNILYLGDTHIPYHDVSAINAALDYGVRKEVNTVILGGDIIDCYQLSSFCRDPRMRKFSSELDKTKEFLDCVQEALPRAVIYFLEGNHEMRLKSYLKIKAPELFDCSEFHMDILLNLGERGIHWIDDKRYIKVGKLNVMHGHELGRGVGSVVNPARSCYLKTKDNTVIAHHHQTSEHSEPTLREKLIACWSVGCLCDLHPFYAPINKWNHGACHIRRYEDGEFKIFNFRIFKGRIL